MAKCTCGEYEPVYYHDENQWEPACWDCYYQAREESCASNNNSNSSEDADELPF
jgi:hypothetical protein